LFVFALVAIALVALGGCVAQPAKVEAVTLAGKEVTLLSYYKDAGVQAITLTVKVDGKVVSTDVDYFAYDTGSNVRDMPGFYYPDSGFVARSFNADFPSDWTGIAHFEPSGIGTALFVMK
jgi:hypothetical protein